MHLQSLRGVHIIVLLAGQKLCHSCRCKLNHLSVVDVDFIVNERSEKLA